MIILPSQEMLLLAPKAKVNDDDKGKQHWLWEDSQSSVEYWGGGNLLLRSRPQADVVLVLSDLCERKGLPRDRPSKVGTN